MAKILSSPPVRNLAFCVDSCQRWDNALTIHRWHTSPHSKCLPSGEEYLMRIYTKAVHMCLCSRRTYLFVCVLHIHTYIYRIFYFASHFSPSVDCCLPTVHLTTHMRPASSISVMLALYKLKLTTDEQNGVTKLLACHATPCQAIPHTAGNYPIV